MRPEDFPDTLPGLNVREGLTRIGGSVESYVRLLAKFSRNQADVPAAFVRSMRENDPVTAERLAHSLAGVAGNIGAADLCAAARHLEAVVRGGAGDAWRDVLTRVECSLGDAIASIRVIIRLYEESGGDNVSREKADPRKAFLLLGSLGEAIDACDANAVRIFTDVKANLLDPAFSATVTVLEESLERYDFDAARKEWRALKTALKKLGFS